MAHDENKVKNNNIDSLIQALDLKIGSEQTVILHDAMLTNEQQVAVLMTYMAFENAIKVSPPGRIYGRAVNICHRSELSDLG